MTLDIDKLALDTVRRLPYTPLPRQKELIYELCRYVCNRTRGDVFVLNGYAGTGKTSLMAALLQSLAEAGQATVVLAPTGRAAKVASGFSGMEAGTIHKRIYRGNPADPAFKGYFIAPNTQKDALFVVDEASMITDTGSASLLRDLLRHVYSAPGCGLIFSGDIAQLPPVGQPDSPAMNPQRLKSLGLNPTVFELDEPVRQAAQSGILFNATIIRRRVFGSIDKPFALRESRFRDVEVVEPRDLADSIATSWATVGMEDTVIITRSNWRANRYNDELRRRVLDAEGPLERRERVIVARNNYFWTQQNKEMSFLANGETAVVEWTGREEAAYGFTFLDAELSLPGHDEVVAAKVMLDSLMADGPSMPQTAMNEFYKKVSDETEGTLTQKMKGVQKNPYFNALQLKYAYCLTAHKAQGGQWRHVYIDMSGIDPEQMSAHFYRWLYTAFTRASEKIFLISPSVPTI